MLTAMVFVMLTRFLAVRTLRLATMIHLRQKKMALVISVLAQAKAAAALQLPVTR
jgi:hypothetical protein